MLDSVETPELLSRKKSNLDEKESLVSALFKSAKRQLDFEKPEKRRRGSKNLP